MKNLDSGRLVKWLQERGLSPKRSCDLVGILGLALFMLSVLVCIVFPELGLTGWAAKAAAVATALLIISLLAASGYCLWQANVLWVMLVLFGPVDILMGFVIHWESAFLRILFIVVGAALTAGGILLAPIQIRNAGKLQAELDRAQKEWLRSRAEVREETPVEQEPRRSMTREERIRLLKSRVHMYQLGDNHPEIAERSADAAQALGGLLMEQTELWVLVSRFPGAKPVYLGLDGRMEMATERRFAELGQQILLDKLNMETEIRTLSGAEEIRSFFADCAHRGMKVLRLDNGSEYSCELWLKDFFPYREETFLEEKNRQMRYLFERTKRYSWYLGCQKDQNSSQYRAIAEMMLTMRYNGYRALENTLVYALGNRMPEDQVYVTAAAKEQLEKWLPGSRYENTAIAAAPVYEGPLQLGFVNRPGEQGDISRGMVCVFTDLNLARQAQRLFRGSNMEHTIVAITADELLGQAVQCAGIVLDMQELNYEIPASEYGMFDAVRKLDAGIIATIRQAPQCRHTEMRGPWKQFDYQWSQRFGYDYMLNAAQWLSDHDMEVQTLVTASLGGAGEKEHIEEFRACGGRVADCVGYETGVLGVGGFSRTAECLLKIYWYNQMDHVRIFTAGDVPQERIDAFTKKLDEARKDFAQQE